MPLLFPVWLVLAAVFFYLAYTHYRMSQHSLRSFRLRSATPSGRKGRKGAAGGSPLDQFAEDFNHYLDSINSAMRIQNAAASTGYFLVGILSLISSVTIIQMLLPQ